MRSKIKLDDYPNIKRVDVGVGDVGVSLANGAGCYIHISETTTRRILDFRGYAIHVNRDNGEIKKVVQLGVRADTAHTKQKHIKRILDNISAQLKGAEIIIKIGVW